ncbi:hypothetical protein [Bosea sp. 124]|uniref:hypothetical protein n=1 Tax=Bosea sp. 124 TaxID=2135642 RepID=UPI000D3820D1|nr:hypothetical protein [Bosea sp. 124]PTM42355.1 hypothetical protein C8D03_3942 [Bosea sp. 124]
MSKSLIAIILAACPLVALAHAPAAMAQDVQFRLSVAWTVEVIEPEPRSRLAGGTFLLTLGKGGKVTELFTDNQRRRGRGRSARLKEGELGEDIDGRFVSQWKVVNERTLVRLVARPSHTFAIWLKTDGARSCTVSLEWRLKPGFTSYEGWSRRREIRTKFLQPTVQHARCEVLQV